MGNGHTTTTTLQDVRRGRNKGGGGGGEEGWIELDAKEYLTNVNLPQSPTGAQTALVQIGRWTSSSSTTTSGGDDRRRSAPPEPWPPTLLELSRTFAQSESTRRKEIYRQSAAGGNQNNKKALAAAATKTTTGVMEEERVDLTALPSVCIDAKRTSFRDDAVGVRPRSSTGRKVMDGASRWELLVHITDVTDVFCADVAVDHNEEGDGGDGKKLDLTPILQAAEKRGQSRYDLPFGPLHLMPPIALDALALVTKPDIITTDNSNNSAATIPPPPLEEANRCVTVWTYLHETTGEILDCGVERTVISPPLRLNYDTASSLIVETKNRPGKGRPLYAERACTILVSRLLSTWNEHRLRTDGSAALRDERMRVRELVARETIIGTTAAADGYSHSSSSFRRTPAHRLVDSSLDLYGNVVSTLLSEARAPIPTASGSALSKGGRVGTAPLRRYIDGMVQRQVVAVLCHGGAGEGGRQRQRQLGRLTWDECGRANKIATRARNDEMTTKEVEKSGRKDSGGRGGQRSRGQKKDSEKQALRTLAAHLAMMDQEEEKGGRGQGRRKLVRAVSSGRENQVVLMGIGLSTKCRGVSGTLKPGIPVMVEVTRLDPNRGLLEVQLASE